MPRLKTRFAEWEDRWWPQPMAAGERAPVTNLARRIGRPG